MLLCVYVIQETLIVWSEGDDEDYALSFQNRDDCDEIWEKICHVSHAVWTSYSVSGWFRVTMHCICCTV